jgi:hypothetical protein
VLWAESAARQTQAIGLRGGTPRETLSSGREAFVPVVKPADFRQCHDPDGKLTQYPSLSLLAAVAVRVR